MDLNEYQNVVAGNSRHIMTVCATTPDYWALYRMAYNVNGQHRNYYRYAEGPASAYCDANGFLACVRVLEDKNATLVEVVAELPGLKKSRAVA